MMLTFKPSVGVSVDFVSTTLGAYRVYEGGRTESPFRQVQGARNLAVPVEDAELFFVNDELV